MRIIDDLTYEISAAYTEPSISQDGQPLTDLAYTELEYRIGASPVEVLEPRQLATSRMVEARLHRSLRFPRRLA